MLLKEVTLITLPKRLAFSTVAKQNVTVWSTPPAHEKFPKERNPWNSLEHNVFGRFRSQVQDPGLRTISLFHQHWLRPNLVLIHLVPETGRFIPGVLFFLPRVRSVSSFNFHRPSLTNDWIEGSTNPSERQCQSWIKRSKILLFPPAVIQLQQIKRHPMDLCTIHSFNPSNLFKQQKSLNPLKGPLHLGL